MPGLYIFLFCPASLGRILSEMKGDRRHVEREIQMLMVYLASLSIVNFPPASDHAQMQTPTIKHEYLRIFLIQLFRRGRCSHSSR